MKNLSELYSTPGGRLLKVGYIITLLVVLTFSFQISFYESSLPKCERCGFDINGKYMCISDFKISLQNHGFDLSRPISDITCSSTPSKLYWSEFFLIFIVLISILELIKRIIFFVIFGSLNPRKK